jgi:hypothetical protein
VYWVVAYQWRISGSGFWLFLGFRVFELTFFFVGKNLLLRGQETLTNPIQEIYTKMLFIS